MLKYKNFLYLNKILCIYKKYSVFIKEENYIVIFI